LRTKYVGLFLDKVCFEKASRPVSQTRDRNLEAFKKAF